MNSNFYFFFLMVPYLSWTLTYFTLNLLTPKKWVQTHRRLFYIIALFAFFVMSAIKTYSATLGVNLIQGFVILTIFLCFEDRISKKIAGYLFFELIAVMIEAIVTSLYVTIRSLIPIPEITFFELPKQTGLLDMIGISICMVVVGIIFYRTEVKILKQCISYLNVWTFFQLMLPLIVPVLCQGIVLDQTENPQFPLLAAIYWLLCLICYPLFLFGVRALRKQGRKRQRKNQQLLIAKEQLAFSQQSEEEYASLRKWNHDSENHLLALAYLMESDKTAHAAEYVESLLSSK